MTLSFMEVPLVRLLVYASYFPFVRTMRNAISSQYIGDLSVLLTAACKNDRSLTTLPVRVLIHWA